MGRRRAADADAEEPVRALAPPPSLVRHRRPGGPRRRRGAPRGAAGGRSTSRSIGKAFDAAIASARKSWKRDLDRDVERLMRWRPCSPTGCRSSGKRDAKLSERTVLVKYTGATRPAPSSTSTAARSWSTTDAARPRPASGRRWWPRCSAPRIPRGVDLFSDGGHGGGGRARAVPPRPGARPGRAAGAHRRRGRAVRRAPARHRRPAAPRAWRAGAKDRALREGSPWSPASSTARCRPRARHPLRQPVRRQPQPGVRRHPHREQLQFLGGELRPRLRPHAARPHRRPRRLPPGAGRGPGPLARLPVRPGAQHRARHRLPQRAGSGQPRPG